MRALGEIKDGVTLYKAISDAANAPGFGPGHGVLGPTRISSLTTLSTSCIRLRTTSHVGVISK